MTSLIVASLPPEHLSDPFWWKALHVTVGRVQTAVQQGNMAFWRIFSSKENQEFFDMGWVRLFYWYGWIPGIVWCLVKLWFFYRLCREKRYPELVLLTSFVVYTYGEAHAVSTYIGRNYVFMLYGVLWSGYLAKKSADKEETAHG